MELVMYAVVLTPSGGASSVSSISTSQKLVRRSFDAATTLARVRDHLTLGDPLVVEEDWAYLSEMNPGVEIIADNVVRFTAVPMDHTVGTKAPLQRVVPWNSNGQHDTIPRWLELSLTVVDRRAAQQLSSLQDWQGRGNFRQIITNGTPEDPSDDRDAVTLKLQARLQVRP